MRPVDGLRGVAVLYRVVVHVIHVLLKIVFVAYQMFPIPPLPDTAFALARAAIADTLARRDATRKSCLDEHPACWKIPIAFGERPDRMKVIG